MAKVTAIVSGKGGVGKSTLCVGLGTAFSRAGQRVLLIDGDAGMRSLDTILGVAETVAYDLGDLIRGNCRGAEALCRTAVHGLWLLPAQQGKPFSPEIMRRLVEALDPLFDRILLDAPAGLGAGFYSACAPAQETILAVTADPVGVRAAATARTLLDECRLPHRMVISSFQEDIFRSGNGFEDLDQVIDRVGSQLLGIVPWDRKLAAEMAGGRMQSGRGAAADAFQRIARRMDGESVPLGIE